MLMWKSKALLALLLLLCYPAASPAAGALGRLFFTPEDRVSLERLRWGAPEAMSSSSLRQQEKEETRRAAPEDQPPAITLEGTVTRGDRGQVVWLNGVAYNQKDLPDNVRLPHPVAAGRVEVQAPRQKMSFVLRSGQTLDMNSGQVLEARERKAAVPAPGAESASAPEPQGGPVKDDAAEPAPPLPAKPGA